MASGTFIVIEGSDGSGKSTHFALLKQYFEEQGHEVATYKFPQYDSPSSYFVTSYLNGKYGDANTLGAYGPSLFYALDRFEAASKIRADLEAGKIVLCDRYIGSNMAHQGQKLVSDKERTKYFNWLHEIEYEMLAIPKPDLNLVLIMPAETAYQLMKQREKRTYTEVSHDIHEADIHHLERAVATYEKLCHQFPQDFTAVHCTEKDGTLRSIDAIQAEIRTFVQKP